MPRQRARGPTSTATMPEVFGCTGNCSKPVPSSKRKRLPDNAGRIYEIFVQRRDIDSVERQILQTEVALARRQSGLVRTETRIQRMDVRAIDQIRAVS